MLTFLPFPSRRLTWILVALALPAMLATPVEARPLQQGESAAFQITYYHFATESSFQGRLVEAPGVAGAYREDFLYSAHGVGMEGTGVTMAGESIHYAGGAGGYWVNFAGRRTDPRVRGWTKGPPYWREGGWRTQAGAPTYRRPDGTWINGEGVQRLPYHDEFGPGPGVPVTPWLSIATDLGVIARGTYVSIPGLADTPAHGCFRADDTGGAIIARHVDVLVPSGTDVSALPTTGDVVILGQNDRCGEGRPPAQPVAPTTPDGPEMRASIRLAVIEPPLEVDFAGDRIRARGLSQPANESFLFGPDGVASRGYGIDRRGRIVIARGGGGWIDARGQSTRQLANGRWTRGRGLWRSGGWRNASGRPTWRTASGWRNGKGVDRGSYGDRFRLSREGESLHLRVRAPAGLAAIGDKVLIRAFRTGGCASVTGLLPRGANRIEVTAPTIAISRAIPRRSAIAVFAQGGSACRS